MKNRFGIIVLSCLLFTFAHAAQNPFQRDDMVIHPITGDSVRVFDILVRIDSADVDGLVVQDSLEQNWWRMAAVCEDEFANRRATDATYHPWGYCYQGYIEKTFRRFADNLYEATNGKHLLGKVYFTKDLGADVDIEWLSDKGSFAYANAAGDADIGNWGKPNFLREEGGNGVPAHSRSGIRQPHRNFFSGFQLMSINELAATLMHEWGHYALGLGDEYSYGDTCTIEHPEKYKGLLVNPNAPISCPIDRSEWKLNASKYEDWAVDSASKTIDSIAIAVQEVAAAYTLAPQLMTYQYVPYHGDAGSLRYANLSTDQSYCQEGFRASAAGQCTPKVFRSTRGGHTVSKKYREANGAPRGQGYSAWTFITRPRWASNLDNLGPYRWPELASAAPGYWDFDSKGNNFVRMDSTSKEIMRHFLQMDWSLWDTTMSYDRSVLFLVDLSDSTRDSVSIGNLKRAISAALALAEDQPNLNVGLSAVAYGNSSEQLVPIQPVKEAVPKILNALDRIRFGGVFLDYGLWYYGYEFLKNRPKSEKRHLVFFTEGLVLPTTFSMNELRKRLDEEGIRFHVHYFLDSAKHLPQVYDFGLNARLFSGNVAYDLSEKGDKGFPDEVKMLSWVLGFDVMAEGYLPVNSVQDCVFPLKSIGLGDTWDLKHVVTTKYPGNPNGESTEWHSMEYRCSMPGSLAPYSLCEMDSLSCREVLSQDDTLSFLVKELGTVSADKRLIVDRRGMARFYSMSGAANLLPGESLLLSFEIGGSELLAGLRPRAEICDMGAVDKKCTTIVLRDNGMHGDQSANDGRYTLYWDGYTSNGPFRVEVFADSMNADAKWVSIEGANSRKVDPSEFVRESAVWQFAVLGDLSDDVPDSIGAGRTLDSGVVVDGRVNGGSDVDCYGWGAHPDTGMVLRVMKLNESSAIRVVFLSDAGDTVLVRMRDLERDVNRMTVVLPRNHSAGVCIDAADGSAANYRLLLDGRQSWDILPMPVLRVRAKDHHFGHPQISVLSFQVENVGETPLEGATLHYFFTMPEATPYLLDYYTPDFDLQIVDYGEGHYELRMQLANDLAPGAIIPVGLDNQLHLRGMNYETLNVLDDWSNPKSVTFVETDSVVITDKNGTIVHGIAPEWWTAGGAQ